MTLTAYTADGRAKSKGQTFAPNGVVCKVRATADAGTVAGGNQWFTTQLNQKVYDPFNFFNTATNRFQPTTPGYYRCVFAPTLSGLATSAEADSYIRKNGVMAPAEGGTTVAVNSSGWITPVAVALVYFNGTTDYIEVGIWTATAGVMRGTSAQPSQFEAELVASSLGVAPEPWHVVGAAGEPAFQNGYANWNSGQRVVRFFKDPHGMVHLSGLMQVGSPTSAAFTLPVGYRPNVNDPGGASAIRLIFGAAQNTGYGNVQIGQDGGVLTPSASSGGWIDLDTVHVRGEV